MSYIFEYSILYNKMKKKERKKFSGDNYIKHKKRKENLILKILADADAGL